MSRVHAERTNRRRTTIYLCLALLLVFPLCSTGIEQSVGALALQIGEIGARILTESAVWLLAALILVIAVVCEPRSLASIGLRRPTKWTPLLGFAVAVALIALGGAASFLTYSVLHTPNHTPAQIEQLVRGSFVYAMFLALRAGVVEEVLYRGLAIEQLTELTGDRLLAALIATSAFVAVHLVHFDVRQLIPIATVAFGLTAAYLWKRNLWINIFAHVLVDALALGAVALRATDLY